MSSFLASKKAIVGTYPNSPYTLNIGKLLGAYVTTKNNLQFHYDLFYLLLYCCVEKKTSHTHVENPGSATE